MTCEIQHPHLGSIRGSLVSDELVQFKSLPYARIPRRFARSVILTELPRNSKDNFPGYDATKRGPCSIQPWDSIETDLRWNQLPARPSQEQLQAEDCLNLTLTLPSTKGDNDLYDLPVVVFLHGGALMVGSGDRNYYDPHAFCMNAVKRSKPVLFVSINYRLGALGFLHCPEAASLLPPNNGLYDQILAFTWVQRYISGFGGNPDNVTAIGQSAGAASLSLHNTKFRTETLYAKAIILSGSTTVLVTMTPEEHRDEFLYQAQKLGVNICGQSMTEIATEVINTPIDAIRRLNYCGAPCSPSELIPKAWATMQHARHANPNAWLRSQILASSTYDGSISYFVAKGQERTQLGRTFATICRAKLKNSQHLLDLYGILESEDDDVALKKICQIVNDIGFYSAAISGLIGAAKSSKINNHLILFDIKNPFPGLLEQERYATHTWDIVSLLGVYDNIIPSNIRQGIDEWRECILKYCYTNELDCKPWQQSSQSALLIEKNGIKCLDHGTLSGSKAHKLFELAEREDGEHGCDLIWENVVRFFLKTGNPRYSHEAFETIAT